MPQAKRIPDARLAELAIEREELKAEITQMAADLAILDGRIIREMERRNTHVIENSGVRITKVQQERVDYDWDRLRARLNPRQWKLCTKTVEDPKGLSAAVQAGQIDVRLVTACSETHLNKPYITVSEVPQ